MSMTMYAMKSLLAQALITIILSAAAATAVTNDADGAAANNNKWSTSAELADLLHTETVLIENLRSYVKLLDTKIATIKNKTQEVRAIYDAALPDTGKYFGNPINTFKLIKRMTYEWTTLRNLAWQDVTEHVVENITTFSEFLTFPTEEDLDESVGSLLRIQDVYQMEPSQVAMGEFDGLKFGSQMTWSDCFAIGQQSFNQGELLVAKVWLQTALDKLPSDARTPQEVNARIGVLEMLANSEYQSGNIKEALRLAEEILKLNPKNKRAIAAQTTFRQALKMKKAIAGSKAAPKSKERKLTEEQLALDVCRGTFEQYSSSKFAGLTCAYATGNLPFLSIGPVRLEIVRVEPLIVIYHNVFSDTEIEGLRRSVQDEEEWSLSSGHLKRLQVLTGYGVGRFGDWILVRNRYDDEAHFQLNAMKTSEKREMDGVMWIQLSQPRAGGFIACPQLEMRVNSPRGSVLYWTTRDEASDVDYRTKHLACPVIAGILEGIYSVTMST